MSDMQSIKEILDSCGMYTGLTTGTSMKPLLHQGKDNIIVVKPKERLKKYDVALYYVTNGKEDKYIMHRVIEVHDDHYIITGDNLLAREYVTDDMVIGKLAGFYKNGKRYIDCENGKLYKLYSRVWVALRPIRPLYIKFMTYGSAFKRKVLKIK